MTAQIAENVVDLPVAVAANQNVGSDTQVAALAAVKAMLGVTVTSKASAVETPTVENVNGAGVAAAAAATTQKATKASKTKSAKATAANTNAKGKRITTGGNWR